MILHTLSQLALQSLKQITKYKYFDANNCQQFIPRLNASENTAGKSTCEEIQYCFNKNALANIVQTMFHKRFGDEPLDCNI